MRWYGDPQGPSCARQRLRKPVAGTVLVGMTRMNSLRGTAVARTATQCALDGINIVELLNP